MFAIKVSITGYISDEQPGFVECKFHDAYGTELIVHEKVPVVTNENLDADSNYPKDGFLGCEIVGELTDDVGGVITVGTEMPWGIETINGLRVFDVLASQLIEIN